MKYNSGYFQVWNQTWDTVIDNQIVAEAWADLRDNIGVRQMREVEEEVMAVIMAQLREEMAYD